MDYTITLLDNALDELDSSCVELEAYIDWNKDENVDEKQIQYALKRAIKHISTCSELLIKYRLHREHWAFIFQDVNKASKKKLETGTFESVRYEDGIKRLENLCGIHEKIESLIALHHLRNKIEHYAISVPYLELAKLIVRSVDELALFCANHILAIVKEEPARQHAQQILFRLSKLKQEFSLLADM